MYLLQRLLIATICISFFTPFRPYHSRNIEYKNLSEKLESAFNSYNSKKLDNLFELDYLLEVKSKYKEFIDRFPGATWDFQVLRKLKDGRILIQVLITAERQLNYRKYKLENKQLLAIETLNGKVKAQEAISDSSILKSKDSSLEIHINIPDYVLTGSKYDADIILKSPIDKSFISGGLIITNKERLNKDSSPYIDIFPLSAGGLFKSIQAPISSGSHTIAALITHPEGIISITKSVKVVSNKEDMILSPSN